LPPGFSQAPSGVEAATGAMISTVVALSCVVEDTARLAA
jgi:hypothetical protein